jgi:dTDP-4-dehydrorhamnose reductase
MRVILIGKNGQMGRSFQSILGKKKQINNFTFVGRHELDLTNDNNIEKYFDNNHFDVIINCAAYTNVDKAEEETALADQINHLAVLKLSQIASKYKAKLIHISTDYVFDGKSVKPYMEIDKTNPINVYGMTKLKGEEALLKIMPTNAMVIRTSWIYSKYGNNFVNVMLNLGRVKNEINVVNDQIGSPTYADDIANDILKIIDNKNFINTTIPTEIYHYSNLGEVSWYDFAKEIFKISKLDCKVRPIKTSDYPTPAKRPLYTILNKDKIVQEFEVSLNFWRDSLKKNLTN